MEGKERNAWSKIGSSETMIIRVFRAKVRPGKGEEFLRLVKEQSIPMVKKQTGVLAIYAGSPVGSNRDEFTVTTVWKDLKHLKAFAGDDWEKSVIPPDELPLLERTWIDHFELFHSESRD
jgi:quinol monooxygenase YgiN